MGEVQRLYDLEYDQANLIKLQEKISNTDVGFLHAIKSNSVVSWNIKIDKEKVSVRRYKKFLPYILKVRDFDRYLYEYQAEGIKWLRRNPKAILADDMGLGKSLQVIKACEEELFENKKECIFVFCPNALVTNWEKEINKWLPTSVVYSYTNRSLHDSINASNFIIISYNQMHNFLKEYNQLNLNLDMITVFDEAHKLRNEGANVSRLALGFRSKTKWLLTGTPLERDEKDIEVIVNILEPGLSIAQMKKDKFLMKSRFTNLTLRRTKEIALKQLPPVSHRIHYVEMTEFQKLKYSELIKEYKDRPPKEKIGVLNKLMIAATHTPNEYSGKLISALQVLREISNKKEKSIVFSKFNSVLDNFGNILRKEKFDHVVVNGKIGKLEREILINKFRTDENCNILLINLSIGSEGLTLTEANNVLFLNEGWNPSMNRQAEDRVNRIGQHRNVEIHIFRSLNSIDINLENILSRKMKLEGEYIDLLLQEVFQ